MKLNAVLKWTIYITLFATPFLALIIGNGILLPNLFFPFITGKNFLFRALVEIGGGAWIILALRDKAYRPKFSWLLPLITALVVVMAIVDCFSPNVFKSFWSNFERMEGWVTLAHLLLYFIVLGATLTTEKLWRRFFMASIGASVLVASWGIFQILGFSWAPIHQGGVRVDSTLGNASYLAIYMVFNIFLTLYLMLEAKKNWQYALGGAIVLLEAAVLYFTATRGAILGILGGLLLTGILIIIFERSRPRLQKISIGVVAAVVIVVVAFFGLRSASFVQKSDVLNRFASISLTDTTTASRFVIWEGAWKGFLQRPLGWGQESFNYVFNANYSPKLYNDEQWFDRAHDIVFDWLITGGIFGFLLYFSLPIVFLWYLWRKSGLSPSEKSLLTGLLAAYFFNNLFVFDNITSYIPYFGLLAYIHVRAGSLSKWKFTISPDMGAYVVAPIVAIVTIAAVYFINVPGAIASYDLVQAISSQSSLSENINYFNASLSPRTMGTSEVREQLVQIASELPSNTSVDASTTLEFVNLAAGQMAIQLAQTPNDARYQVFMGSFLDSVGEPSNAIPYFQKALQLSPGKQSILFGIGSSQIALGDYTGALATFKTAYDEAPAYTDALKYYAAAAIYDGNQALANQLLSTLGTSTPSDSEFIQAYLTVKNYPMLAATLQAAIAEDPADIQDADLLVEVYLVMGQKQYAINEINAIVALNPSLASQAASLIAEIKAGTLPTPQL